MQVTWYDTVMSLSDLSEEDFFEKITMYAGNAEPKTSGKFESIFHPLLDDASLEGYAKHVALYIVMGYSMDSKEVLLPKNWSTQKKLLFDKAELPESLYRDVVELKNLTVKKVIIDYLDMQEDFDYKHLKMKQDLYDFHMNKVYEGINGDESEGDPKDTWKMLDSWQGEINDLKRTFRERYEQNNDNRTDVAPEKKVRRTTNIATSNQVRKTT